MQDFRRAGAITSSIGNDMRGDFAYVILRALILALIVLVGASVVAIRRLLAARRQAKATQHTPRHASTGSGALRAVQAPVQPVATTQPMGMADRLVATPMSGVRRLGN